MHPDNAALYEKIDIYENALEDISSKYGDPSADSMQRVARMALKEAREAANAKKKA